MNSGDVLKDLLNQLALSCESANIRGDEWVKIALRRKEAAIFNRFLLRCLDPDYGDPGETIENLLLTN